MTNTATRAAPAPQPAQAALLPELAPPSPGAVRPRAAVWGLLAEDARHYTSADGTAHVQVLIHQHVPGHPEAGNVLATYHYPDTGTPNVTAQLASHAAAAMRQGAEVVASGEGLRPYHHNGHAVLVLGGVRSIRPIEQHIAPPHHQPTGDH